MDPKLTIDTTACRRCGTCCEQGGPALHHEDRPLLESGALRRRDLVAIRSGEPAYDQRQGRVVPASQEFLKLAGARGSWRCKFYDKPGGCGIYGQRPLECRLLFCRDTTPLEAVMGRELLSRRDLLAAADPALEWLAKLEQAVGYPEVMELLAGLDRQSSTEASLAALTSLVRADLSLRESFLRSFTERGDEEMFLLGRPLFLAIAPFGCRLVEGAGGTEMQYTRPG
jgi:Fe-S-cluster containining protein